MLYLEAQFKPHAGPCLFEFQRDGMPSREPYSRLDGFFGQLPKDLHMLWKFPTSSCLVLSTTKCFRPRAWDTATTTGPQYRHRSPKSYKSWWLHRSFHRTTFANSPNPRYVGDADIYRIFISNKTRTETNTDNCDVFN